MRKFVLISNTVAKIGETFLNCCRYDAVGHARAELIHFFESHQSSRQQNLRNEQQGDDIERSSVLPDKSRHHKRKRNTHKRREHHDPEMVPEHVVYTQYGIAHQQIKSALQACNGSKNEHLCCQIPRRKQLVVALSPQQRPIPKNLTCGIRQPEKHGQYQRKEQVFTDMQRLVEGVRRF